MSSDHAWDKLLQIKTVGRDEKKADEYHHPYEPTPYCVLERLADSGLIGKDDVVLDYGCGKGRVGFFLSQQTDAKTMLRSTIIAVTHIIYLNNRFDTMVSAAIKPAETRLSLPEIPLETAEQAE